MQEIMFLTLLGMVHKTPNFVQVPLGVEINLPP